ncbi:MAG TPA: hypothetical protein VN277_03715 [Acidiferrobacterales bacterium]|nr:hypothetical protein [Acidiferrobacterales bacterium]
MHHRRLYYIALFMWAAPLVVASVIMLGFLFLRSSFFVVGGMVLLAVGGLCLSAGLIAVIAILATRNKFQESPRRYYKKPALRVLGLLLLNLPIATTYVVVGGMLLERAETEAVASPSGHYLAEIINLDANEAPPYGQAVTLRPKPGLFQTYSRTIVFSSYCLNPRPMWRNDAWLVIACSDARGVVTRQTSYRGIKITYLLSNPAAHDPRRTSR